MGAEGEGSAGIQPFLSAQRGGLTRVGGGEGVTHWDTWARKGRSQGEGLGTGGLPPAVTEAEEEGRVLPAGTTYQVIPDPVP